MAENYITDKAKATRLKRWSAVLFVFSALQLALQVAILVKFKSFYDDPEQSTWVLAYNGMIIADGVFNLICSMLMLCCIASSLSSKRGAYSQCFIFFALTIALLSAIASVAVSALESHLIRNSDSHPCQPSVNENQINCDAWFGLEVGVAVSAGITSLVIFIIIVAASKKSIVKPPPVTSEAERVPQQQQQQQVPGEVTVPQVAAQVTEEPVLTPKVVEVELPNPVPVESNNKPAELSDEMLSYAQELRKMTREELEREMARQFQIKFLKELRLEIDRRNLFSDEQLERASSPRASKQWDHVRNQQRRSDASSVASSKRTSSPRPPPIELPSYRSSSPNRHPPTPDYDLNE